MAVRKIGNRWYCYCMVRDSEGKRHQKILEGESFRTRKEAELRDAKWKLERAAGKKPVVSKKTFGEAADKWLETQKSFELAESTLDYYETHVNNLKSYFGVDRRIDKITEDDCEGFKVDFGKTHMGRTVNKNLARLKSIFKYAAKKRWIAVSPCENVEPVPFKAKKIKALKPKEVFRIAAKAEGQGRDMILFDFFTGLRDGELFRLEKSNIDLEEATATVVNAKTPSSYRIVKLGPQALEIARRALLNANGSRYLFSSKAGTAMTRQSFYRWMWRPALEKAGYDVKTKGNRLTPHVLRHSFASYLINSGAPVTEVQHALGHASPDTTMRIYSHWFKARECDSISQMGEDLKELYARCLQDTALKGDQRPALSLVK
ncbi:MAG: tyrosine-type recombinase/integrase [Candidatus Aquicultorales bacterium]